MEKSWTSESSNEGYPLTDDEDSVDCQETSFPPAAEVRIFEERVLGKGVHGIVFEGTMRGNKVAVKRFRNFIKFETEVSVMQTFPSNRSILELLWYSAQTMDLVTPLKTNGNLATFLKENRENISPKLQICLAIEITFGIFSLHQLDFVHGDISSSNILIDENMSACLCDFALAKRTERSKSFGNVLYCAPEFYKQGVYTRSCDIFSLGMVLYEIFFNPSPHIAHPETFLAAKARISKTWPTNPNKIINLFSFVPKNLESIQKIITLCLSMNPEERPSCAEILNVLTSTS